MLGGDFSRYQCPSVVLGWVPRYIRSDVLGRYTSVLPICGGARWVPEEDSTKNLGVVCQGVKVWNIEDITRLPRDVTSLRSFLRFANYYRWYVEGYAHVVNSLMELTKKGVIFQWGLYPTKVFVQIRYALCTAPILQYPKPSLPYVVVIDASNFARWGVLMQDHDDGLHPLAFLSKWLKPTEQCYSAYEHELATIAYSFLAWWHYLEGCLGEVTITTDHQHLTSNTVKIDSIGFVSVHPAEDAI